MQTTTARKRPRRQRTIHCWISRLQSPDATAATASAPSAVSRCLHCACSSLRGRAHRPARAAPARRGGCRAGAPHVAALIGRGRRHRLGASAGAVRDHSHGHGASSPRATSAGVPSISGCGPLPLSLAAPSLTVAPRIRLCWSAVVDRRRPSSSPSSSDALRRAAAAAASAPGRPG